MRRGKLKDRDIKLYEGEHKILLDRFDLNNVVIEAADPEYAIPERYAIKKPCLCKKYPKNCYSHKLGRYCPLYLSEFRTCISLIQSIIGRSYYVVLLNIDSIQWDATPEIDKMAREDINKIRKALLSMKKV